MSQQKLAVVAGVGQGLGGAVCAELSHAGYHVAALARTSDYLTGLQRDIEAHGGQLSPVKCDLLDETSVTNAFAEINAWGTPVSVYIHNAGQLVMDDFLNLSARSFEHLWRLTCMSAFLGTQQALPAMVERQAGTVILTGATASIRGGAKFAAFASAKFALRGLAQSLAREFGPKGIHIAHVILDGVIDCDWTRKRFNVQPDRALQPEHIAKNYISLINQHRSTWTHELDLRPDVEQF